MTRPRAPKTRLVPVAAALCAALLRPAAAAPPPYTVTDLGTFGGPTSITHDLNDGGQTVGTSDLSQSLGHGFVFGYNPATPPPALPNIPATDLFPTDTTNSDAKGINAGGTIVGYNGSRHAFVGTPGSLADLGTFGGSTSVAFSINAAAKPLIVGGADTTGVNGVTGDPIGRAFAHPGPGPLNPVTDNLGALPGYTDSAAYGVSPGGGIVGTSFDFMSVFSRATLFDSHGAAPTDLGGLSATSDSDAYTVNDVPDPSTINPNALPSPMMPVRARLAVGDSDGSGDGVFHPVLFSVSPAASPADLGLLPGFTNGIANGINAGIGVLGFTEDINTGNIVSGGVVGGGDVVGDAYNTDMAGDPTTRSAFLSLPPHTAATLYDLNSLLPAASTIRVLEASAVNDYGQIAASGTVNGQVHALLLSPTPLIPATGGLNPPTVTANTALPLIVTGSNFAPNSVIYVNGKPEPTQFNPVTPGLLRTTIPAADIGTGGSLHADAIQVGSPTPGNTRYLLISNGRSYISPSALSVGFDPNTPPAQQSGATERFVETLTFTNISTTPITHLRLSSASLRITGAAVNNFNLAEFPALPFPSAAGVTLNPGQTITVTLYFQNYAVEYKATQATFQALFDYNNAGGQSVQQTTQQSLSNPPFAGF